MQNVKWIKQIIEGLVIRNENLEIEAWQARPNTFVRLVVELFGIVYEGIGFSKVTMPDEWDELYGEELAFNKAVSSIAKQVIEVEGVVFVERLNNLRTLRQELLDSVRSIDNSIKNVESDYSDFLIQEFGPVAPTVGEENDN